MWLSASDMRQTAARAQAGFAHFCSGKLRLDTALGGCRQFLIGEMFAIRALGACRE
jgi:hypothetical protein